MKKIYRILYKTAFFQKFIFWTKNTVLPGFNNLPIYSIASFFLKEIQKESLQNRASSLAYNFMMAIFPAIIFLFTLIPYIPIKNFQNQLMSIIALLLPANAYHAFEETLVDIVKNQNGKLLSIGFILALFFATNGIHTLMMAFNKASLQMETRTWGKQRFVALNLTLLTAVSLILGVSITVITEFILNRFRQELNLDNNIFWVSLIAIGRWLIIIAVYFFTTSTIYKYGPAKSKKWKLFSPGAWLATFLAIITTVGFSFFINNFGAYNKIYGSIGTLLVVMIWMYLNSLILILGFELNASIELYKEEPEKVIKRNILRPINSPKLPLN